MSLGAAVICFFGFATPAGYRDRPETASQRGPNGPKTQGKQAARRPVLALVEKPRIIPHIPCPELRSVLLRPPLEPDLIL